MKKKNVYSQTFNIKLFSLFGNSIDFFFTFLMWDASLSVWIYTNLRRGVILCFKIIPVLYTAEKKNWQKFARKLPWNNTITSHDEIHT